MREKSYTIPYWSYLWFFRYSRWNKFHSFTLLLNFKKTEIDIRSYKKSKLSKKENWLTFSCQILFCHIVILCCEPSLYFAFHFLFFPLYFPYTNSFFIIAVTEETEIQDMSGSTLLTAMTLIFIKLIYRKYKKRNV